MSQQLDPIQLQALYYLATGLWPLIHLPSFMALTGPKRDTWLVQTFGALVTAIGGTLLSSRRRSERTAAARLAVVSALTLAAADTWFVAQGRIRPVYLADAALELMLAAAVIARGTQPQPSAKVATSSRDLRLRSGTVQSPAG
jgi:hypothetical protein